MSARQQCPRGSEMDRLNALRACVWFRDEINWALQWWCLWTALEWPLIAAFLQFLQCITSFNCFLMFTESDFSKFDGESSGGSHAIFFWTEHLVFSDLRALRLSQNGESTLSYFTEHDPKALSVRIFAYLPTFLSVEVGSLGKCLCPHSLIKVVESPVGISVSDSDNLCMTVVEHLVWISKWDRIYYWRSSSFWICLRFGLDDRKLKLIDVFACVTASVSFICEMIGHYRLAAATNGWVMPIGSGIIISCHFVTGAHWWVDWARLCSITS